MGEEWKDCITTVFDLDGTKDLAPSGLGSRIMRDLHHVVAQALLDEHRFPSVTRAYAWNDSALFLTYVREEEREYERALRDAAEFKPKIDAVGESYCVGKSHAVAVKGQVLPPPETTGVSSPARFVFIEASSYAMANCLRIPSCFKEKHYSWYLDERITDVVGQLGEPLYRQKIQLLPKREERIICAYDDLRFEHAPT